MDFSLDNNWWDGLIDSGGELIGGALDIVGDASGEVIAAKVEEEKNRVISSDPDSSRAFQNLGAQQNGDALSGDSNYSLNGGGLVKPWMLGVGGGFMMLVVILLLVRK